MGDVRRRLSRVRAFFLKRSLDADLKAEIADHIEFATEENIRRGMTAQKHAARRSSGSAAWKW
jgi:hypothetical protein